MQSSPACDQSVTVLAPPPSTPGSHENCALVPPKSSTPDRSGQHPVSSTQHPLPSSQRPALILQPPRTVPATRQQIRRQVATGSTQENPSPANMAESRKDDAIKSVQVEALVSLALPYVFLPTCPGHRHSPSPGRGLRERHITRPNRGPASVSASPCLRRPGAAPWVRSPTRLLTSPLCPRHRSS